MERTNILLALFVVFAILIIVSVEFKQSENFDPYPVDTIFGPLQPPENSPISQLSQDTFIRPDSTGFITAYADEPIPYTIKVTLYAYPNCPHMLIDAFDFITSEFTAEGGYKGQVHFTKKYEYSGEQTINEVYPIVVKERQSGQVMIYRGRSSYAPLRDWITNETLRF